MHNIRHNEVASGDMVASSLNFLWLEITGKCNLTCSHCYADSLPSRTHGSLTLADWTRVIMEAKLLGVETVQFIGGEPTVHPHFQDLIRVAFASGLNIEVFSNLLRISPSVWEMFEECEVSLATSFYSWNPEIHDHVTQRKGSNAKTLANISEALRRTIPLRVGLIEVMPEQNLGEADSSLRSLGVTDIGIDRVRGIGRGANYARSERPIEALCGACADSKAAVDPDGWVYPCVFSRWMRIGNVRTDSLNAIVNGEAMTYAREELFAEFSQRPNFFEDACDPEACNPRCTPRGGCNPNCPPNCSPTCNPRKCNPRGCWPQFG